MGDAGGQRCEKTNCIQHGIEISTTFQRFQRTLRWNGHHSEHQLWKALDESSLEWRRVVKKEHLGGTKILTKLFEQIKMLLRPCCKTGHHLICNSGITWREKLQLRQKKCPKNILWRSLVVGWIPTNRRQTKCFGRPFAVCVGSDGFNVRGAWSEISRGAAVKHFVEAALWYFLRGAALQHLSSGGGGLL